MRGEIDTSQDELAPEDVRFVEEMVLLNRADARLVRSKLDQDKTRLSDRAGGLFKIRGNDELIEEARRDAEDRIVETALENGILEKAQNNAEDSIRVLVTSLGYREVRFA